MTTPLTLPIDHEDSRARRLMAACRRGSAHDIVPLLRQVLLSSDIDTPACIVPSVDGLHDVAHRAGLRADPYGAHGVRVTLGPGPDISWLDGDIRAIDLASTAPGQLATPSGRVSTWSRYGENLATDPAFERATTYTKHLVAAQRDAARAIALAPPGTVTHLVLPTGSGKSDIGLLPALAGWGQVIVVVPTVAIALDQESSILRRHGERLGLPDVLAWHAGLDAARRAGVKERLQDGTQQILVTSPESLVSGLETSVRHAAELGQIHTLTVDEAHLIHDWGLSFRPEFQDIASLRELLVETATASHVDAPRTVLQTATLHEDALRLNDGLFPNGDRPRLVGSVSLRTEPRYLRYRATDVADARQRFVDLLYLTPRPAIVYASRKRVVEEVLSLLRQHGFARVTSFTGDTSDSERRRILRQWQGRDEEPALDVVVATTAFGLGVDQPDVRAVIHAETPSSVGSFYQEVGRGGRDGHACVSVLITSPTDEIQAPKIADHTLISNEKAIAYWASMKSSMQAGVVDLGAVPAHLNDTNERVQLWSRNTLVLIQWAGLIRVMPAPLPGPGSDDEAWAKWGRSRRVELQQNFTEDQLVQLLDAARKRIRDARRRDRDDVRKLHHGTECFGKIFATAYALDTAKDLHVAVNPVPACSGCPGCRRDVTHPSHPAIPVVPLEVDAHVPSRLEGLIQGTLLVVHEDEEWLDRKGRELVQFLVAAGIRHLFLDHEERRIENWLRSPSSPYIALDSAPVGFPPFLRPSLVYRPSTVLRSWRAPGSAVRVIVVPTGTPAPDRPAERLDVWWSPSIRATDLLEAY